MIPMNNPIARMAQLLQAGRDPQSIVQMMVQQNPQAGAAMQMLNGKTPQQKEEMVRNMCRERGTTPEDLARSLGIVIPSSR